MVARVRTLSVRRVSACCPGRDIVDDIKTLDADGNKILMPLNFQSDQVRRVDKAMELTFERRFSKNFQALAGDPASRNALNSPRAYQFSAVVRF